MASGNATATAAAPLMANLRALDSLIPDISCSLSVMTPAFPVVMGSPDLRRQYANGQYSISREH